MKRINIDKSRHLRKSQTDTERKLWSILRNRSLNGIKFRRQFPIGNYILDFYSPDHKLAIEADGGHHYGDVCQKNDSKRDEEISQAGIKIYDSNLENALAELPAVRFLPDSPFYSLILFKEFIQQRSFQLPGESLVLGFAGKRLTEAYKMLDQNPNFQNSKQLSFCHLDFRISNLFRVSSFEFRI